MCSCEDAGYVMPHNTHQVQTGFLLHYKDSTLLWYESQMAPRPQGSVYLKVAPELIATGQVARRLFHVPNPPSSALSTYEHVIAIGERRRQRVHFFLADNQHELSAWLSAIVSTLPVATAPPLPTPATGLLQPTPTAPGPHPATGAFYGTPYQTGAPPAYAIHQQQQAVPAAGTTTTVVVRDAGNGSYGDVAVGMAAGAVMGAALSSMTRPSYGYCYPGHAYGAGGSYQDNDVTVVNNYNVEYNAEYNVGANAAADWSTYDDDIAGFDL